LARPLPPASASAPAPALPPALPPTPPPSGPGAEAPFAGDDGRAGPQVLPAVEHHPLARPDAGHHRVDARRVDELDRPRHRLVALDHVDHPPARALHDGGLRHDDRVLEGLHDQLDADEGAGPQLLALVVELGLHAHGPGVRIHRVVDEGQLAGEGAPVFRQHGRDAAAARAQRVQRVLQVALRQVEADGDRVELGDRDQRRRARLHQRAGEHVDRAGAPRARRDDAVVRQRDLRRPERGAVSLDHRALGVGLRLVGVERGLRDEVLRQQLLASGELALRVGQRSEVLLQLGLRLRDVGLVRARIEREQQLPRLDELAFLEMDRRHRAADLRLHVDAVERGDRAGDIELNLVVALLRTHGADADRRAAGTGGRRRCRRRGARPVVLAASGDGRQDKAQENSNELLVHAKTWLFGDSARRAAVHHSQRLLLECCA
jgi:hypothetical protein